MKIYIDFDGVILDTDSIIDKKISKTNIDRREFIKNYDWNLLMRNDIIINDSLNYIKKSKYNISLLSKICSINEAQAKVKFLRNNEVLIDINFVPTGINKSDIVSAKDNVLIDDKVVNLDSWSANGGISIFFNKDGKNIDIYDNINTKYKMITDLSCLVNGIK